MIRICAACLVLFLSAAPGRAADLTLPDAARLLTERASASDSYALPIGPFQDGQVPVFVVEGQVERRSWRVNGPGQETLPLMADLRAQLEAVGYEVVFQCRDRDCGGFDFRFQIEVIPAPDMHVDVRNYRFLSATRAGQESRSILVSAGRSAAYVQIVSVRSDAVAKPTESPRHSPAPAPADLIQSLLRDGHVVLADLDFRTGATRLGTGPYESLASLAAFLDQRKDVTIALVGHTDSKGALDSNIALSKRRAQAVRDRLIAAHGVQPDRLAAEGMGYLSPIASNLEPAGREANRRVEAILLPR